MTRIVFEKVEADDCERLAGEIRLSQWQGTRHLRLSVDGKDRGVLMPGTDEIKRAMSMNVAFGADPSEVALRAFRLPNAGANRVYLVTEFEDESMGDQWVASWNEGQSSSRGHASLGEAMQAVLGRLEENDSPDEG